MRCPNCNQDNVDNAMYCSKCGSQLMQPVQPVAPVAQPYYPQPQPVQQQVNNGGLTGTQKGIILGLLGLVIVLLVVVIFTRPGGSLLTPSGDNTKTTTKAVKKEDTRTIMIYLEGSNLESDAAIATAELDSIDAKTLDLTKTTVLVYTGGTKKWYNFISNSENAIYKLKSDNTYEKLETYAKQDMADPKTLASFLKYGYEKYKAGHMDLVLFDHGAGALGAIQDDFTGNMISLANFKKALEDSPFNSNNKLEVIAFRTCLNGTIENAVTFAPFSEYLVASEDVTWGHKSSNVFGHFINGLKETEDGLEVGKKFVNAYKTQIDEIAYYPNQFLVTYAVIDLSKADKLSEEFQKFINGIDVKLNYSTISRVRSRLLQFAMTSDNSSPDFDTVDMYELVNGLSGVSTVNVNNFNNAYKDAVKYFYTNDTNDTHGISVYFPYNASNAVRSYILREYKSITGFTDYLKFISNFNDYKNGDSSRAFSFNGSSTKVDNKYNVFLNLSKEQKDNYSTAYYFVFKKDKEMKDYYQLIYRSYDVEMDDNGELKANIGKNLIQVKDDNKYEYVGILRNKTGNMARDTLACILYNKNAKDFGQMDSANITIVEDNGKPMLGDAFISHRDQRYDGIVRDINEYTTIDIPVTKRKILDKNGKVLPIDQWISPHSLEFIELTNFKTKKLSNEVDLRYVGPDQDELYVLFVVVDLNGKQYLSEKLVKVGE